MGVTLFTDLWPPEGHCIKQRFTDRSTRFTVWDDDDQVDRALDQPVLKTNVRDGASGVNSSLKGHRSL